LERSVRRSSGRLSPSLSIDALSTLSIILGPFTAHGFIHYSKKEACITQDFLVQMAHKFAVPAIPPPVIARGTGTVLRLPMSFLQKVKLGYFYVLHRRIEFVVLIPYEIDEVRGVSGGKGCRAG